jgi:hypothetical protein
MTAPALRSRDRAVEAAGGWQIALRRDNPIPGRPKALELRSKDMSVLEALPDLEFLNLNATNAAIEPVNRLSRLRGLAVDSWVGDLNFANLPRLEWFHVTESDEGALDTLYAGHDRVHHVEIGKYRRPDLTPLTGLPALVRLEVFNTRKALSLDGLLDLAPSLRALDLALCTRLESLDGIGHPGLESLDIQGCNRIDDLAPLADARNLKLLQLEQAATPPLGALADHPSLEIVSIVGRVPESEVRALMAAPALRMIVANGNWWVREGQGGQFEAKEYEDVANLEAYRFELMRR